VIAGTFRVPIHQLPETVRRPRLPARGCRIARPMRSFTGRFRWRVLLQGLTRESVTQGRTTA